jgi:hypothetical protein
LVGVGDVGKEVREDVISKKVRGKIIGVRRRVLEKGGREKGGRIKGEGEGRYRDNGRRIGRGEERGIGGWVGIREEVK